MPCGSLVLQVDRVLAEAIGLAEDLAHRHVAAAENDRYGSGVVVARPRGQSTRHEPPTCKYVRNDNRPCFCFVKRSLERNFRKNQFHWAEVSSRETSVAVAKIELSRVRLPPVSSTTSPVRVLWVD